MNVSIEEGREEKTYIYIFILNSTHENWHRNENVSLNVPIKTYPSTELGLEHTSTITLTPYLIFLVKL